MKDDTYAWFTNLIYRKPVKPVSMERLHDVWLKLEERDAKRNAIIENIIQEIFATVPEVNGTRKVYLKQGDDYGSFRVEYNETYDSWTYPFRWLRDDDEQRVKKTYAFLHDSDPSFVLGNKLYLYETTLQSKWKYNLFNVMWRRMEDWLYKNYKGRFYGLRYLEVPIGSKTYNISAKGDGTGYIKFEWMGTMNIEKITPTW